MEKVRRDKMQVREKVGKSRFTVFFQWFGAPEGRKVTSVKRRVRSQLARWEMKNCTPLWGEAHFQVKMYKTRQVRTTFGSWDVGKVHAVVARSTCPSQNTKLAILGALLEVEMSEKCTPLWPEAHVQVKMYKTRHSRTTFGSWDVGKVHAVVARSTFPSQNTKHAILGALLEVEMSEKCTPLWREAHVQVKMYKTRQRRPLLEVEMSKSARRCGTKHMSKSKCTKHHAQTTFGKFRCRKVHAVVARSTCPSQNVQNTSCSDHFWKLRCRKSARRCGAKHVSK